MAATEQEPDEPLSGTVHVNYTVPVVAVVNLATGEVDRVVVVDDEVKLDPDYGNRGVTNDAADPADDAVADAALEIAEGDEPWPGWEFGF
jgi:hypothetical protein